MSILIINSTVFLTPCRHYNHLVPKSKSGDNALAGQPGWSSIIPIYNLIVWLRIVGRPLWWIILFFVPFVNIVISIIITYQLAKVFGKGVGFTIGLILLPFIFYPILAFGQATYSPLPRL